MGQHQRQRLAHAAHAAQTGEHGAGGIHGTELHEVSLASDETGRTRGELVERGEHDGGSLMDVDFFRSESGEVASYIRLLHANCPPNLQRVRRLLCGERISG